jgi:hypothetical protein
LLGIITRKVKKMGERILPTGKCWCGCGADVPRGSFFLSGHDRRAESAVITVEYGGVVEFLAAQGYIPGGKNPIEALKIYLQKKNSDKR